MRLENFFSGNVICELYYTYTRERTKTTFFVKQIHDSLLIFDENMDLYWKASYLSDEDSYAITNNWCKSSETWSIRDSVDYAQRVKILKIVSDNSFESVIKRCIEYDLD